MSQQLRQPNQIVAVVSQELMRHRMPEQVGMQVDPDQGRILLTQRPDATLRQCATLPDEDTAGLCWWACVKVSASSIDICRAALILQLSCRSQRPTSPARPP
jgi:hypothetical protein